MKKQIIIALIFILINLVVIAYILIPKKPEEIKEVIKKPEIIKEETIENDTLKTLKNEKYYLEKNKDLYLNYYDENKNIKPEEIIRIINTKINYEFYTNTKKADISKEFTTLVNKYNYLDNDFEPENLVSIDTNYATSKQRIIDIVFENYKKMFEEAKKENMNLIIASSYRNYNSQKIIYQNYVKQNKEEADTFSAKPGFSEHQLGLAIDILKPGSTFDNFENTKEAKWLRENAYKFGFILRYDKDFEYITGYKYEPWHYRYVGLNVAKYIFENNITFDEYHAFYIE